MHIPDPKWLDVFKLPLKATIAAAMASSTLIGLVLTKILDLGALGPFALPILMILAVLSTTLVVVGTVHALFAPLREKRRRSALQIRRAVRCSEKEVQRSQAQATVLARLDHLSREEIAVVAKALRNGSPTFYTYVYSPSVGILQGKGLVWTTGGTHHQDHYPFSFHDYVWQALAERKDEFIEKDEEHKRAEEARKRAERRTRGY